MTGQILPVARPATSRGWTVPVGPGRAKVIPLPAPKPTEEDEWETLPEDDSALGPDGKPLQVRVPKDWLERVARKTAASERQEEGCRRWHETHRRVALRAEIANDLLALSEKHGISEEEAVARLLRLSWAMDAKRVQR